MHRLILLFALPVLVHAAGCDAAIGDWKWFNGGTATLTAQKTVLMNGKQEGRWECSDANKAITVVRWKGGFVDTLSVAGNRMTGKNQQGISVSADRKGAQLRK